MNLNYTYLDCLATLGVGGAHPGGLKLTREILAKENLNETTSILDVGCGTGQTSAYIKEQYNSNVTSLDSNKTMITKASQRFSDLQLPIVVKQGLTENLPFDDAVFDIVLSESVVLFTNIPLTLAEFKRVLKQDSVLLAIEMVLEQPISVKEEKSICHFYGINQLLTESEWYVHLQRAGFNYITIEKYNPQIYGNDLQDAPDFLLSETIDNRYFEMIEEHEHLSTRYRDILGFRIFRCK